MARYNKVYAGPVTEVLPQVDEIIATASVLPGCYVTQAGALAVAATATEVLIAQDDYLTGKDTDTAYDIGDLIVAMKPLPTQIYNARVAATVAVTKGAALALGASGLLVLATAGARVVAFAEETVTVGASADLVRVRPATGYRLEA
jgi:hypothetical protein